MARHHDLLLTLEEGATGGFAAHVMQFLALSGLLDNGLKFRPLVMPDTFLEQASPEALIKRAGLDAEGIVRSALAAISASALPAQVRA